MNTFILSFTTPPALRHVYLATIRKTSDEINLFIIKTYCSLFLTHNFSEWREKRDADLARRAEASAEKKAATVAKAQEDIDDFYEAYNKRTDKAKAQTHTDEKEYLENREDTSAGGTSWERIAKLVDISGKGIKGGASGSGKERFRELLLDLKKDENAPGVGGV